MSRTGEHPPAASAAATRPTIGEPSTSITAFGRPIRRLAPPISTAPATSETTYIDVPVAHSAGTPDGSSWARNVAHRSASSSSPIAAAIRAARSNDRRNPRLVGADQRT